MKMKDPAGNLDAEDALVKLSVAMPPVSSTCTMEWAENDTAALDSSERGEQALGYDIKRRLLAGPVELSRLANAFAKRFNTVFHQGRRANDGSWSRFLSNLEGVNVATVNGKMRPESLVSLTNKGEKRFRAEAGIPL